MGTYGEAAITRLCLKNFLTYGHVEYRPEPGLNMIIGPNGSGKSSLVCAICLALAGQTKLLGRAQDLKDFIKYGCETAELEIELFQRAGNIVINRRISANRSDWKINGRSCGQGEVVSTVAKLNIQVDNLCQFLPQDRVADFAKMSPQELLVGTEQAVGSVALIENHEKLKTFQKTSTELTAKMKSLQGRCEEHIQRNEHLEAELRTFREYQKAKTQLNIHEAKVAWLIYDKKRQAYLKLKKSSRDFEEEFTRKKKTHAEIKNKLQECNENLSELARNETVFELSLRKISEARDRARQDITANLESIEDCQHEFKRQLEAVNETKKKIDQDKKVYYDLRAKYDESARRIAEDKVEETFEAVKSKIHSINTELNKLHSERERLQIQLRNSDNDILEAEAQIQQHEQRGDQQLQHLKRLKPQVYEACLWLRKNQSVFKKKIHEPPLAVMRVKTEQAAAYLDGAIGADSLFCFVAEDPDDMEQFVRLTRKNNWRVNAATAPHASRANYRPSADAESVATLGVTGYLSDLFEAPDAVFAYLCENHNLHRIPYGNEKLEDGAYLLYEKFRILNSIAKDTWVTLIKSRYSSEITRCTRSVKPPKFLHVSREKLLAENLVEKLKRAKEAKTSQLSQLSGLRSELENFEKSSAAIKLEEKKLKQRLSELHGLRDAVRVKKAQLDKLVKAPTDLGNVKVTVARRQEEKIRNFSEYFAKISEAAVEARRQAQQLALVIAKAGDAQATQSRVQEDFDRLDGEIKAQEEHRTRLQNETREARIQALDCLERAKTLVGFGDVGTSAAAELPEEYRKKFEPLSNDISELKVFILDEKERLALICPQNSNVEAEYEKRKGHIAELQTELDKATRELEQLSSTMNELEASWKAELHDLIAKVDQNFARFFSMLGCEGRILVRCGSDEREYDQYGIKIMVRFREQSELCELTPFHQSGGERSVTTILYMMALQEMTVVPFRVVDEINQGMDSVNERRVFEFIVRTAEANNAQYFLITPKLLPDLPYSEKMHVHVITSNSQFNHSEWDFDAFLSRRRELVGQR